MFHKIKEFESHLAEFTGAPYAVTTDCCTHAIELCLILDKVKQCHFTTYTYLSVIQTMHKLDINYTLIEEPWIGEYHFYQTRIWDSARRLEPDMYKEGYLQCLSFGFNKPVDIGRGGAILCNNYDDYKLLSMMRYDGRDLDITPWIEQPLYVQGYHYKLNPEECIRGIEELENYKKNNNYTPNPVSYPDCRSIKIK